jgi:sugar (pentulose or hexulose) kinase
LGKPDFKGRTVVVDIGKTNAKISLWERPGTLIDRRLRSNDPRPDSTASYRALDTNGIEAWLIEVMREFASDGAVARIVTVGHGAAAALLRNDALFADPMDYEIEVGEGDRAEYDAQRDPFNKTGSPALPLGLNLGVQLHLLEREFGPFPDDLVIVPWAQYWAWRFCGVAASEATSLGCHTDLWRPGTNEFSELAIRRGWASRMAPLQRASHKLGCITGELKDATGLNGDCEVYCGLHDSNAALLAARGHREIADNEATVLSTGTWFVAMRSLPADSIFDIGSLQESRDCLVNVDAYAQPTPSARFMGGREAELAGDVDSFRLTDSCAPEELLGHLPDLIDRGSYAVPSFVAGVGPFPNAPGVWHDKPSDPAELRAATDLYLALVADTALTLIGSRGRLLIEGRFAEDAVFVRSLAALRPSQRIYVSNAEHDVAYGALRLIDPTLSLVSGLTPVEPVTIDLGGFAARWREQARLAQEAA